MKCHFSKSLNRIGNQSGMILVASLAMCTMIAFIALAVLNSQKNKNTAARAQELKSLTNNITRRLVAALDNKVAWQLTTSQSQNSTILNNFVNPNSNPSGFGPTESGGGVTPVYLKILDHNGNVIVDPYNSNLGFNWQGEICQQFNMQDGNDNCPFLYRVQPIYKDVSVTPTKYTLKTELIYKPRMASIALNTNSEKFSFLISPGFNSQIDALACEALSGVYDYVHQRCSQQVGYSVEACAPGQAHRGVASTSTCINIGMNITTCNGRHITGFDVNNNAVCENNLGEPGGGGAGGGDGGGGGMPQVNCVGSWSTCTNDEQRYIITVFQQGNGTACEYEHRTVRSCVSQPSEK